MSRWLLPILIVIIIAAVAGVFITRAQALAAPPQPIAYSHRVHVGAGIQCLFCHSGAQRSALAGIPSVQKCMGCHNTIATDRPEVQVLAGYWQRSEPIPWKRVNRQPDFVFFSHQAHLGAGLNCETCHGDVSQMDGDRPVVKMDMGWCLNCHSQRDAQTGDQSGRLADCLTCHK